MRGILRAAVVLLPVLIMSLAGCGGSSSGNTNPFTPGTGDASTPTGSGTVLSYKLSLSVPATVGSNGSVIATATLTDSENRPVSQQPIKFEAIEGPVTIATPIQQTVSDGTAVNVVKADETTTSAVDVILKASSSVNGQLVTAVAITKILRSETNIIKFLTTKSPTDPDGTLNTIKVSLNAVPLPSDPRMILQLVPFQVLDNNGYPRTRVPVTVSVYSEIGNCPVFIDSPETLQQTVTTDDTGKGIFNAGVVVAVPEIGSENSCSLVYKVEAPDWSNPAAKIFSYGGFIATLVNTQANSQPSSN
ncbi:hypothetical protein [Geomonas agri]|uniref:hypothetical protein n=1 Tax=Geomonas agri TaxID=2873702 RepID=UPI001CD6D6C1|nr:hypothetical protein [Geomonas agri]